LLVVASMQIAVTTLLRRSRRSKVVTRLAPAALLGSAIGAGLRTGGASGFALAALAIGAVGMLAALYRRRGADRTPCATCPERLGSAPCRGYAEIVHRERAFRRLASRVLARAGI
jgi:hypothetical protein